MKSLTPKLIVLSMVALCVSLFMPLFVAQASTYQPTITSIDQVKAKSPVPHDVNWTISQQAEDGDKTIDHFQLTVTTVESDTTVCTIDDITADALTYRLSADTCTDLDVFNYYTVELLEVYDDDTESNEDTETFRTKPPKPKSLRIKDKQANSVRVRFKRGVQIAGEYLYIDYKVSRKNKPGSIVENGSVYSDDNYVDIDGLPANKALQVRVRFRSSSYGNSPWSAWKKFKTLED